MTNILCLELLSLVCSNCPFLDQMHCGLTPGMELYILLKGQAGCSEKKKNTNCKSFLFLDLMCILFGSKGSMNKTLILSILICFLQLLVAVETLESCFCLCTPFREKHIHLYHL